MVPNPNREAGALMVGGHAVEIEERGRLPTSIESFRSPAKQE